MAETGRVAQRTGTLAKGRPAEGLYDPALEHDACGVAFVADVAGRRGHRHRRRASRRCINLDHRGAAGAEPNTGDGAGILIQVPDALPAAVAVAASSSRPPGALRGRHRLPAGATPTAADAARRSIEQIAAEEGLTSSAGATCRSTRRRRLGPTARGVMPRFRQLFVGRRRRPAHGATRPASTWSGAPSPAQAGRARVATRRRSTSRRCPPHHRLQGHADHRPARARSSPTSPTSGSTARIALVHSRFSTNTFPAWPLAHPYRLHRAQRRDQHASRATATGCAPARRCSPADADRPGRPRPALPDLHPGRQRLGHLRRGARAAAPRRPHPAARGADDDPGGVGEPRRDGPGAARPSTSSTPR